MTKIWRVVVVISLLRCIKSILSWWKHIYIIVTKPYLFLLLTSSYVIYLARNITNCYSPIFLGNGFFQIKGCIYYKWWRLYYFASSRVCRLTTSLDTNVNDNSYDAHCNWICLYDKRYVPFAWSHSWG